MMWLVAIGLFVSVVLNCFFVWYSYNAIRKLQFMSNSFETIDIELQVFDKHLRAIHALETYYGDQTLQALIKHSKHLVDSFVEVRKDYEIFNGDIDEEEYIEKEQNDSPKAQESGEDLFLKRP